MTTVPSYTVHPDAFGGWLVPPHHPHTIAYPTRSPGITLTRVSSVPGAAFAALRLAGAFEPGFAPRARATVLGGFASVSAGLQPLLDMHAEGCWAQWAPVFRSDSEPELVAATGSYRERTLPGASCFAVLCFERHHDS